MIVLPKRSVYIFFSEIVMLFVFLLTYICKATWWFLGWLFKRLFWQGLGNYLSSGMARLELSRLADDCHDEAGMVFARGNGTACRVSRVYLYSCSLDGLLAGKPNMIAGAGGHKDGGRQVKLPANVAVGKSVFRRRRAAGEMYAGAGPSTVCFCNFSLVMMAGAGDGSHAWTIVARRRRRGGEGAVAGGMMWSASGSFLCAILAVNPIHRIGCFLVKLLASWTGRGIVTRFAAARRAATIPQRRWRPPHPRALSWFRRWDPGPGRRRGGGWREDAGGGKNSTPVARWAGTEVPASPSCSFSIAEVGILRSWEVTRRGGGWREDGENRDEEEGAEGGRRRRRRGGKQAALNRVGMLGDSWEEVLPHRLIMFLDSCMHLDLRLTCGSHLLHQSYLFSSLSPLTSSLVISSCQDCVICVGGWLRSRCWNLELEAPIEMGIRRMASRDAQPQGNDGEAWPPTRIS